MLLNGEGLLLVYGKIVSNKPRKVLRERDQASLRHSYYLYIARIWRCVKVSYAGSENCSLE